MDNYIWNPAHYENYRWVFGKWIKDLSEYENWKERIRKLDREFVLEMQEEFPIKKEEDFQKMVKRAKEYPLKKLVSVNSRGFALCPFHKEKTPSFSIKDNTGHCFGCQKTVDSIQFLRDRDKLTFSEAVIKLNNL